MMLSCRKATNEVKTLMVSKVFCKRNPCPKSILLSSRWCPVKISSLQTCGCVRRTSGFRYTIRCQVDLHCRTRGRFRISWWSFVWRARAVARKCLIRISQRPCPWNLIKLDCFLGFWIKEFCGRVGWILFEVQSLQFWKLGFLKTVYSILALEGINCVVIRSIFLCLCFQRTPTSCPYSKAWVLKQKKPDWSITLFYLWILTEHRALANSIISLRVFSSLISGLFFMIENQSISQPGNQKSQVCFRHIFRLPLPLWWIFPQVLELHTGPPLLKKRQHSVPLRIDIKVSE